MKPKYVSNPGAKTFSLADVQHGVWWDTLVFDEHLLNSQRLFGNANIGYLNRSNLQCGGQLVLSDGQAAIFQRWFARTNVLAPLDRIVESWAADTVATFVLSNRATWQLHLSELFLRRPRNDPDRPESRRKHDPWPCVMRARQAFYVSVDMFEGVRDRVWDLPMDDSRPRPTVTIVFEGLVLPERLVDAVLSILMTLRDRRVAAHVEIVDYIMGLADQAKDPAEAELLRVVMDGILEHKALL